MTACRNEHILGTVSRHGLPNSFVNLGGDIALAGPRKEGQPWQIAANDPRQTGGIMATLNIEIGGLATSGNYERYWMIEGRKLSHIFNPKTGWPIDVWPSVTVAAESCLGAGLNATIALMMEGNATEFLETSGTAYLGLDPNGKIHTNILLAGNPMGHPA